MSKKKPSRGPGFTCVFCEKHFSGSTSQPIHIRRHIQEKPYNCRVCDFSATCITDVYLHERKVHSTAQYKCPECKKVFKNDFGLQSHIKAQHRDPLSVDFFQCSICNKHFKLQSNLTVHMRLHSEAKYFECENCGKRFAIERSLMRHKGKCRGGEEGYVPVSQVYRGRKIQVKDYVDGEEIMPIPIPMLDEKDTTSDLNILKIFSVDQF